MGTISTLPVDFNFDTISILKKLADAHKYLGELKGVAATIPNPNILIETLVLQEAKESSAIENIISTYDEVYQSNWETLTFSTASAKEVHAYSKALQTGVGLIHKNNILTLNHIIEIQSAIEKNNAGFRKLPGTRLLKDATGEVVYEPPQDYETILFLMENLEQFINNDDLLNIDPIIKMAIIHLQFESIHPFYDGNGRTGRIINILYLMNKGLLSIPILYLSRYIIRHKNEYYRLLNMVRKDNLWEEWVLYMLDAVVETSKETTEIVLKISNCINQHTDTIKQNANKIYSLELINNLFKYPYTKIEYLMSDLNLSRNTIIRYLEQLIEIGIIQKKKIGRDNFYINISLLKILKHEI
jgi:Fic family protein